MVNILVQPPSESVAVPTPAVKIEEASSTPGGGHYLSSTPGGTRIWYTRDQLLSLQSSSPGRVGPRPAAPASMSDFASSEGQVLTTEAPVYGGLTTSVEGSGIGLRNNFTTPVDSPRLAAVGEESQFEIEF